MKRSGSAGRHRLPSRTPGAERDSRAPREPVLPEQEHGARERNAPPGDSDTPVSGAQLSQLMAKR